MVSPEFDKARIASLDPIMPRSPWLASTGCTNCAGVPVEARVAAILRAICPLLPSPVTMILPGAAGTYIDCFFKAEVEGFGKAFETVDLGPEDATGHGQSRLLRRVEAALVA